MQKLKHGDRVTCEIDGTKIDDARISVDNYGGHYICQNEKNGFHVPAQNKLGYKYSWMFDPEDPEDDDVTNLTVIPRTLDDLMVGDVVEKAGNEQTILARTENLVALSKFLVSEGIIDSENVKKYWCHKTIQELKAEGYTLHQYIEEPIEELTMEEVCKRLGKRVKIKK